MVTIKDIAKKAGVSITTVSRALNNYYDVSPSTKKKIFDIADEMGYVPNRSAQNLVKKTNNTLAIILSGLEKEGGKDNIIYRLLSGMYSYAESVNYEVVLYTTSSAHQRDKTYVQFCKEHNIGGAVLNGIKIDDPYFEELIESDFPCVLIDILAQGKNVSSISINNYKASIEATQHLIKNNHKNIAMINGRRQADVSSERYKGYAKALRNNDIPIKEEYIIYADYLEDKAYKETIRLLTEHPEITALFCASDMMALGAMKAVNKLQLRIPEDISIIGFDNIPLSEYMSPPLTTVDQDFYVMGEKAGEQLLKMIKKQDYEKNMILKHKLLVRKSVGML